MNKTIKKIIIIAGAALVTCAAVVAAIFIIKNNSTEVPVYPALDFIYTGNGTNETSGIVTADKMQNVYVSGTQQVTEIAVTEGQSVKVGDKLLAYDTTLSDIELQKAEINLERLKLNLSVAEKELASINALSPYSSQVITPDPIGIVYEPHETKVIIDGDGTDESPYYYLWADDDVMDESDLMSLIDARRLQLTEADDVYVTFIVRENNALNAPVISSYGIYAQDTGSGLVWSFYEPVLSDEILAYESEPESYIKESGSPYTAQEIAQLRKDKQNEIKDITASIEMAKVELDRITLEVNDGTVCSKIDGVVKICRDPEEAANSGEPVIVVSGGGGYLINCTVSEADLDIIVPGKTVNVISYMSGVSAEGVVTEVSEYPVSNASYYGGSNNSYYPFTVSVSEDAGLTEDEYVDITYAQNAEGESVVCIENMFVRSEDGRNYIMLEGSDGRLEKRFIEISRIEYSSVYIKSGLSEEDYIAFPYGNAVREGARTYRAESNELYSSGY